LMEQTGPRTLLLFLLVGACRDSGVNRGGQPSSDVTALVKAALPAVVRVIPRGTMAQAAGSGFVVRADGGRTLVVTNHHVVWGATEIVLERNDRTLDHAIVLAADAAVDLAVVAAQGGGYGQLSFGDDDALRIGDPLVSIGSPAGVLNAVSVGVLSARGTVPDASLPGQLVIDHLFTDAMISPGCSGGPVLDAHGLVVGVNAATLAGSRGLGVIIPSRLAARIATVLQRGEGYRHSSAGLRVADAPPGSSGTAGVQVTTISPGGSADVASLRAGDILRTMDGRPLRGSSDFLWREFMDGPGTIWQLGIQRGGESLSMKISLQELSPAGPVR
jgi:S1-C subfamily serine protease